MVGPLLVGVGAVKGGPYVRHAVHTHCRAAENGAEREQETRLRLWEEKVESTGGVYDDGDEYRTHLEVVKTAYTTGFLSSLVGSRKMSSIRESTGSIKVICVYYLLLQRKRSAAPPSYL